MIGATLGPYRLESELGSGGMGTVYLATSDDDGHPVAVKVVHPQLTVSGDFAERFVREAQIGMAINHPNVVRTIDVGQSDGRHYLVMEYVEGQTLDELTKELERLPEELCRHIGREVSKGLTAIHGAGAVHRDLKPENVLVTPEHDVKVMDLGVARLVDEVARLSQTGAFFGSLNYAAPEQFERGGKDLDGRVDLHAVGLLLYELSTGESPFDAEGVSGIISQVIGRVPPPVGTRNRQLTAFFEQVVGTLLEKKRENRFGAARELLQVLEEGESSAWWRTRAQALRAETRKPLRRIRIPRETAVYGREGDLARLRDLYRLVSEGEGRLVLVEGEAGIGKTRLVDEFLARLHAGNEDVNVLFSSYAPGGAATASGAFATAFREHFGEEDLEETLAGRLTTAPLLVPAFAALLRGELAPEGSQRLTEDSLRTMFVHATRALAAERPTILWIDDLHFAPEAGRALLASLATAAPGHRILLLATARPGLPDEWLAGVDHLDQTSRLRIARLGTREVELVLADALGSDHLAADLAPRIVAKSDGNPLFVLAILRELRAGGVLRETGAGTWTQTSRIDEIEIPSSVLELIQARLAALPRDDRELLDVAACCGFEFDPTLLAETAGMRIIPLLRMLGRIERQHRLVRAAGRRFVFDHHQVQEVLHDALSPPLRQEYHASIADALESREAAAHKDPKEIDGALAVDLCQHFFKGARGRRAMHYLDVALDHLDAGYLNESAIALAGRALGQRDLVTGAKRIDLLLRNAARLGHLGRRDLEGEALEEANAVARTAPGVPATAGEVTRALGVHLAQTARYGEALEMLGRAQEEAAQKGDTKLLAEATDSRGLTLYLSGRTEEALQHFERAIELFRECGERRGAGVATGNLGIVLWQLGRLEEAKGHLELQLEISREVGDRIREAATTGNLGIVFLAQGLLPEARAHFERHLEICREIGHRAGEGNAAGNLATVLTAEGRLEEARAGTRRRLEISRETRDQQLEAFALGNLGSQLSLAGRNLSAREHLDSAIALARQIGAKRALGGTLVFLAVDEMRRGEEDAARESLTEAIGIAREIGEAEVLAEGLLALFVLALERGEADAAAGQLSEALETARAAGIPRLEVLAHAHRAALPGGDAGAALAALEEHEQRMGMPEAMEARFILFVATGDPAHLAKAHRRLLFLRDHAGAAYRTSILEHVPLHRDIVAAWEARGEDVKKGRPQPR